MSRRETNIVRITVLIAVLCLAYVFSVEPTLKNWQHSETQIEILNQKLSKMKTIISEKNTTNSQYAELTAPENAASPGENSSAKFLEQIASITAESGMAIEGVSPLPDRKYDFYDVVSARLDVECGLEDLVRLIVRLRNSPSAIEVSRMEIGPRDRDTKILRGYIEVSMTILERSGDEVAETIQ